MVAYTEQHSEREVLIYLRKYGYKRIISIYPKDNCIICWYEN